MRRMRPTVFAGMTYDPGRYRSFAKPSE